MADHSKFNHTSYNRLASFSEIDALITDKPLDERWRELLSKYKIAWYWIAKRWSAACAVVAGCWRELQATDERITRP